MKKQNGMALLVSLIFLLLLTIIGVASMQNAGLQEKMAGNVKIKNESFQLAERALRDGENYISDAANAVAIAACSACAGDECHVPDFSGDLVEADGVCDVWRSSNATGAFYQLQRLGESSDAVSVEEAGTVTLYRVTAVATKGSAKTALESIYAHSN